MKTIYHIFLMMFFNLGLIFGIEGLIHLKSSAKPAGEREKSGILPEERKVPRRKPEKQKFPKAR